MWTNSHLSFILFIFVFICRTNNMRNWNNEKRLNSFDVIHIENGSTFHFFLSFVTHTRARTLSWMYPNHRWAYLVEWKRIVMIFTIVIVVVVFAEIHFWTNTRTLIFQTRFRCARSVRSSSSPSSLSSLLLTRKRTSGTTNNSVLYIQWRKLLHICKMCAGSSVF